MKRKERMIWFGGDVELIRKSLEEKKANMQFVDREYMAGKELERLDQDIQSIEQLLDQLDRIKNLQVQHLIQIDLGPESYNEDMK